MFTNILIYQQIYVLKQVPVGATTRPGSGLMVAEEEKVVVWSGGEQY